MLVSEYQEGTAHTAVYGQSVSGFRSFTAPIQQEDLLRLFYVVTKLNGEAGELAEHVAKALRDDQGTITPERKEAMLAELGDVLWYCSQFATELDTLLDEVMQKNLDKLQTRLTKGTIHGSGSDR